VSARTLTLLSVMAASAALALRMIPVAGTGIVLPPPPDRATSAALRPASLEATGGLKPSARPLTFVAPLDPTRTPRESVDAAAIRLTGIVSDGRRALALIAGPGGEPQTLARGDDIGGWTIDRIGASSVRLKRRNEVVEKKLFVAAVVARPPAPSPSAYRPTEAPDGAAPPGIRAQEPASAPAMPYLPPPGRP